MEFALELVENEETQFNQICYMSVELMRKLHAIIRSCIQINNGAEEQLCVVYPKHGLSENVILCSKTVKKIDTHEIQTSVENGITNTNQGTKQKDVDGRVSTDLIPYFVKRSYIDSVCRNKLTVSNYGIAKHVNIRAVFSDKAKLKYVRKIPDTIYRLQEQCINCLNGIIVADSYAVDLKTMQLAKLYGISYIHIESVQPMKAELKNKCFLISKNTKVSVSKLHSAEWYEYMRNRRNGCVLGGLSDITKELLDLVKMPVHYREHFTKLGVEPPKGILLRGPPGCGKTSIVKHVAHLSGAYLKVINGPEILGSLPGETESNLEKAFEAAALMSEEGPCIVFIDEIDSLCAKSSRSNRLQQSRVTGKILSLLDRLKPGLVVIGATNRPSVLDPAFRRPGRMDREISINPPTIKQRREILDLYLSKLPTGHDLDIDMLADITNGYVGADLAALCQEAAYTAMVGARQEISMETVMNALKKICPSLQRGAEGVVDLRPVQWSDIGGLETVKSEIRQAVEWPMKHPEAFRRMSLKPSKGVLLYGPPGCCKTTLVRAAATSCHATFLSISGAQLYSPYVGDSERLLSEIFQRARLSSPSIIFLDEIDSIVGKRSEAGRSGVQERVLSTLLNEMDGVGIKVTDSYGSSGTQKLLEEGNHTSEVKRELESKDSLSNNSVLLVAATNRPDLLDEALMRPGRIDKVIYVPHPDLQARKEILRVYTKNMDLSEQELDIVSTKTDLYTGADLESLCREAALCALTENMESNDVHLSHFLKALASVKPSLNDDLVRKYSPVNISSQR